MIFEYRIRAVFAPPEKGLFRNGGQKQMDSIKRELVGSGEVDLAGLADLPDTHSVLRTSFDVSIAALILVLLAPLLATIALMIRLDSRGPALFRQTRTGLNGRTFLIYKFRTMHVQEDDAVVRQAQRGDSRLTGLGAILRKTSLDELPQLLNVLCGDMALVGPRPHALAHDSHYGALISNYRQRFAVRPGITGWAQINGSRGATPEVADMRRRIDLDLWYVENRSLALDLKILVATALHILPSRSDAY
ncbi:sugar transferase [Methylobacterium sp. GC_Met_2]|uniref:sugar transferase n=1 Tax=Methylobacterium sp. GC_Met_2 TaxID=2937376 RepID=UPI00226BBCE2|nr:sugar transferase [Methylobacterium sp. GC_Met_2]